MADFDADDRDMKKYIIGTIGSMDMPMEAVNGVTGEAIKEVTSESTSKVTNEPTGEATKEPAKETTQEIKPLLDVE